MSIKIGRWEIAPQSGAAGTHAIGHKMTEKHTGRKKYQKLVRATFVNASANKEAVETLEVGGAPVSFLLDEREIEVAYNTTSVVINCTTNAEKIRLKAPVDTDVVLLNNTGYTVEQDGSYYIAKFTSGFGEQVEGTVGIKVGFDANKTTSSRDILIQIQAYDELGEGSGFSDDAAKYLIRIVQSSSDTDVTFTVEPSTLEDFAKEGGSQEVTISSNVPYSMQLQGSSETAWVTLSRESGTATTEALTITAAPQAVGSPAREVSIKFKSNITNSVIGTLIIKQAAGEDYAISWEQSTLVFTNSDVNTIKINNLTANADWYIEENL